VTVDGKVVNLLFQRFVNGRRFDYRRSLHGGSRRSLYRFTFNRRVSTVTEMRADFIGLIIIERTGVRFLVRNTNFGQVLDHHITLHFQFTCQFVDPNLPHA